MHLLDAFNTRRTTFSFEFFPPRSEGASLDLFEHIREFEKLKPTFVSVTYGAGGSTRQITHDLVVKLRSTTTLDPMPHLTCVGHSGEEIDAILERYAQAGINKLLALRGDVPKDASPSTDIYKDLKRAADLVDRVRRFNESGRHPERRGFTIGVAGYPEGHPETPNRMLEIERLKAQVDQGANFIITQLFFDNRDFYDFRDRCELAGIRVPIIAGIMPITSLQGMKKMAELAAGSRYPAPLIRAVNRAGGNDEAVRRVGTHWATEQSRDLLDHRVAGIHFYTLNKSTATRDVYSTLGVQDSLGLL